ncbi:MAG: hypothetical protein JSR82_14395 [Verrucomicrobia bacterium]|nr:hypothetical protein [Verrucomicrobiota bacterium]
MSDSEIRTMFLLLRRYAVTEMDQWDLFKFDANDRKVFISISLSSQGQDSAFTDVSHLLESESFTS